MAYEHHDGIRRKTVGLKIDSPLTFDLQPSHYFPHYLKIVWTARDYEKNIRNQDAENLYRTSFCDN